jgi:hypothetical protein
VSYIAQTPLLVERSLHLLAVALREVAMEGFVHNENMALYKKLIAESERNPKRDEDRHNMLLTLLAKEWLRTHERAAEAVAQKPAP